MHKTSTIGILTYDGLGRRVTKLVQNCADWDCTYRYYYDGHRLIETRDGSNKPIWQCVWGTQYVDELIHLAVNETTQGNDCTREQWAAHDANYNVIGLFWIKQPGESVLVERYEYTPYGQRTVYMRAGDDDPTARSPLLESKRVVTTAGTRPYGRCDFGMQGKLFDKEWGCYTTPHRTYNPLLGRWHQPDPIDYPDGMSRFQGYRSNPFRHVDPMGAFVIRGGHAQVEAGDTLYKLQMLLYGRYSPKRLREWGYDETTARALPRGTLIDVSEGLMNLAREIEIHRHKRWLLLRDCALIAQYAPPSIAEKVLAQVAAFASEEAREAPSMPTSIMSFFRVRGINMGVAGAGIAHGMLQFTRVVKGMAPATKDLYVKLGDAAIVWGVIVEADALATAWKHDDAYSTTARSINIAMTVWSHWCPPAAVPVLAYGFCYEYAEIDTIYEETDRGAFLEKQSQATLLALKMQQRLQRLRKDTPGLEDALKRWAELFEHSIVRPPAEVLEELELRKTRKGK